MPICPKDGAEMFFEAGKMKCKNQPVCRYEYTPPERIDITKILNENAILKRKLVEIREAIESAQTQGRKLADIQFIVNG